MATGHPLYLSYRVLDPVSGAEVIRDLPHLHQSSWQVFGYQPGASGSTMVGKGTIPLDPPLADGPQTYTFPYNKLAYGQRIEGYLGNVGAGDPKVTGYITELPTQFNSYQLGVEDSTWLAAKARTDRSLAFNNTTDVLLKNSLKAYGLVVGDDFTGANLAAYTNDGTWVLGSGEIGLTLKGVTAGAGGDGLLYTTASYTNAQYADCVIDGVFKGTAANTSSHQAECGIIAAVADTNNYVLGQMLIKCVSSGHFQYTANIYTKIGGVSALRSTRTWIYDTSSSTLRSQVRLFGTQSGANYTWRLVVNGYDPGCTYTVASTPSGAIGFRSIQSAGSGTLDETVFASNLCFQNKQALFAQGTISAGSNTINQTYSRTPLLDLWNIAAGTEGFQWRKNPKTGLFADTIDFGSALGTDLSSSINGRFEEGGNLVDCIIEPNAEPLATEVELTASPGTNNLGVITWHNIAAQRTYGVIAESFSSPDVADPISQFALVNAIATKRGKPGAAKTITVLRDAQTADKWRELDTIMVDAPSLGLNKQAIVVQGYTITEGSAQQVIYGDQYPLGATNPVGRLARSVDALMNRTASVTGNILTLDGSGNPASDGSGLIGVMSSLGIVQVGANVNITTANNSTYSVVTGSSGTITLARQANVLILFFATAHTTGNAYAGYLGCEVVGQTASGNMIFDRAAVGDTNGFAHLFVSNLVAGTYTVRLRASTDAVNTIHIPQCYWQAFQLGA